MEWLEHVKAMGAEAHRISLVAYAVCSFRYDISDTFLGTQWSGGPSTFPPPQSSVEEEIVETFKYFWVEVDVERAAGGGVNWFQTYAVRKTGRIPYSGIKREDNGLLVYKDTQTSDCFDPSTGRARSYVRHIESGDTTYAGQTAWATMRYDRFMRYFARAQITNCLRSSHRFGTAKKWKREHFESVRDEMVSFGPPLERMRTETEASFSPTGDEGYMFIWHVLAAMRGEPGAIEAVDTAHARVFERWGWENYDGLFQRLLGKGAFKA